MRSAGMMRAIAGFCAGENLKVYFCDLKDKPGGAERVREIC